MDAPLEDPGRDPPEDFILRPPGATPTGARSFVGIAFVSFEESAPLAAMYCLSFTAVTPRRARGLPPRRRVVYACGGTSVRDAGGCSLQTPRGMASDNLTRR